jgi:hypothetical protein
LAGVAFAVALAGAFFAVAVDLPAVVAVGAFLPVDLAATDLAVVGLATADLAGAFAAVDRAFVVLAAGAFFVAALVVDLAATLVAGASFAAGAFFAVDLAVALDAGAFFIAALAVDLAAALVAGTSFDAGAFFAVVDFAALATALCFAGAALSFVDLTARVALDTTFSTVPAAFVAALAGDVLAVVRVGMSASSTAGIALTERAAVRPVNAPRRTHAVDTDPHVAPFADGHPGRTGPSTPPRPSRVDRRDSSHPEAIRPHSVVNHPKNRSTSCRSPPTDNASRPRRP